MSGLCGGDHLRPIVEPDIEIAKSCNAIHNRSYVGVLFHTKEMRKREELGV